MNYDEKPLPTSENRRRSLFDEKDKEEETKPNETLKGLPEEPCEIFYPPEYIEKVRREISQWTTEVQKTLGEKEKFDAEIAELKKSVLDESVLTAEQLDFFDSVNLEDYFRKTRDFCDRATIFMNFIQYKPASEAERWYYFAQRKIRESMKS